MCYGHVGCHPGWTKKGEEHPVPPPSGAYNVRVRGTYRRWTKGDISVW